MLIIDYLTTISNNFYHISYLLYLDMNQLEIEKQLRLLKNNWKLINNKIQINLKFSNFDNAFNFMKEVAKECDLLNHHPHHFLYLIHNEFLLPHLKLNFYIRCYI